MGIGMIKVGLQSVASTAASASTSVAQKSPVKTEKNADAVKVALSSTSDNQELKAQREQIKAEAEEREQRARENAEKNFVKKSVQFLGSGKEDAPVDLKFRVVESDSGRVVVEYPADVAIKKMEKAMEEQKDPGQVINKAV